MSHAPPASPPQADPLVPALSQMLGGTMGVRIAGTNGDRAIPPQIAALAWLMLFGFVWVLAAAFCPAYGSAPRQFVGLLAWGAVYFAAASFLAQTATARIIETVREDVVPHASPKFAAAVAHDIESKFGKRLLIGLPLLIAAASVAATLYTLDLELKLRLRSRLDAPFESPEILLLSLSYFLYFYAAAAAVIAARFYWYFAAHLEKDANRFYVLGAADTPLVRGLSRLATQVLIFWVLIFLAILSSMVLVVLPAEDHALQPGSHFLFTMVPIAGFFSLGFGTLVYLGAEARIRTTLQRFTHRQAKAVQERINAILAPKEGGLSPDPDELRRLKEWNDQILAGGRYGSRLGTSISIALPLILPVAGLIVEIF